MNRVLHPALLIVALAWLSLPPLAWAQGKDAVALCDQLAADPDDPHKRAVGVADHTLDFTKALAACEAAARAAPEDITTAYQLARLKALELEGWTTGPMLAIAKQGYRAAQVRMGFLTSGRSDGVADNEESLNWYLKAADQGDEHARAMVVSGLIQHHTGIRDVRRGEALLEDWAAEGGPRLKGLLGVELLHGENLTQDIDRGLELLRVAAAAGVSGAKGNLGLVLIAGHYTEQDIETGLRLMEEAFAEGYLTAGALLGNLYANGEFVPWDPDRARRLFCTSGPLGRHYALKAFPFEDPLSCD